MNAVWSIGSSAVFPRRLSRRAAFSGPVASGLAAMTGMAEPSQAVAARQEPAGTPDAAAYQMGPRIFQTESFNFEFLFTLGGTFEQTADIGECFAAASQIIDGDFESWCSAWEATGARLKAIGDASDAKGHRVSARAAYLRASTYFSLASWFALGTSTPDRLVPTWELHRACLEDFLFRLDVPAKPVTIPYEETTLPGYALLVDDSGERRPWIILNNGSDGTDTTMWATGAAAALRRGYNALIFDGPGQNAALHRQHLYFRPDWEHVVTPVVDYLLTRDDVDPDGIVISGISQGGYWVPRAVAFEHRIAAAVADPGVYDVATSWTDRFPPEFMTEAVEPLYDAEGEELEELKAAIDGAIQAEVAQSPEAAFTIQFRTLPYGTSSMADALLLLREYTLDGVVEQIQYPMLITDPEGEEFWPDQSAKLYDALQSPKTLVRFTAADGADGHVEPKAMGRRNQVIFDWLDETLGRTS